MWENAIHCWTDLQHYRELFYQEGFDPYTVQREAQVGSDCGPSTSGPIVSAKKMCKKKNNNLVIDVVINVRILLELFNLAPVKFHLNWLLSQFGFRSVTSSQWNAGNSCFWAW